MDFPAKINEKGPCLFDKNIMVFFSNFPPIRVGFRGRTKSSVFWIVDLGVGLELGLGSGLQVVRVGAAVRVRADS